MSTSIPWTSEQRAGIQTPGRNLLVSAAAGSGKTAVLAERCAYMVCDAADPCDVDELLVVTFNDAAAAEVKTRIEAALRGRLDTESPPRVILAETTPASDDDVPGAPPRQEPAEHAALLKQLALIGRAPISTVHAFCARLLRQHFHRVGIDPHFAVLDAEEARLLANEVARQLFYDRYENDQTGAFDEFIDHYGNGQDEGLRAHVIKTHALLRSVIDPDAWIVKARRRIVDAGDLPLAQSKLGCELLEHIGTRLTQQVRRCDAAIAQLRAVSGFTLYAQYLVGLRQVVHDWSAAFAKNGIDALAVAMERFEMPRLPTVSKLLPKHAFCKALVESVRSAMSGQGGKPGKKSSKRAALHELVRFSAEQWQQGMRQIRGPAELYLALVQEFGERYAEARKRAGGLDFSDLETLALRLLRAPGSEMRPSAVALLCQRQFKHVLVDEYQDINEVQDAILNLVSRQAERTPRRAPTADRSGESQDPLPQCRQRENMAPAQAPAGNMTALPDAVHDSADGSADPAGSRQALAAANLFCVGDVKQSIYRFRLAEPGRFIDRSDRFKADPTAGTLIDLQANFRSRGPLLAVLNDVFRRLMTRETTDIDYDRKQELVAGLTYPPTDGAPCFQGAPIELHVLDKSAGSIAAGSAPDGVDGGDASAADEPPDADAADELDRTEREAIIVAGRIRQMMARPMFVARKIDNELVHDRIGYRDIVILLRTLKIKADQFADILRRHGIPLHRPSGAGYFNSAEVSDMLSLLRIIDNPRQDIPLAAVLRSPLAFLPEPEDSLARIRLAYPPKRGEEPLAFHEAVVRYAQEQHDELAARLRDFLADLADWRQLARQRPLAELIWTLYERTGYLTFCGGLPNGTQRRANLIHLHERARQFGSFARQGLYRFLEFLDSLAEESDFGEPSVLSEAEDVVRIMSIHKAKGLEFPVVFVPDLGKGFNITDTSGPVLVDRHKYLGLSVADPARRVRYPSMASFLVREEMRRQILAEELRVLYVALTRAREHLILVGTSTAKIIERWKSDLGPATGPLPADVFLSARTMLDWIGPLATALVPAGGFQMHMYSAGDLSTPEKARTRDSAARLAALANLEPLTPPPVPSPLGLEILRGLGASYAYERFTHIPASQSVSAWTKPKGDVRDDAERGRAPVDQGRAVIGRTVAVPESDSRSRARLVEAPTLSGTALPAPAADATTLAPIATDASCASGGAAATDADADAAGGGAAATAGDATAGSDAAADGDAAAVGGAAAAGADAAGADAAAAGADAAAAANAANPTGNETAAAIAALDRLLPRPTFLLQTPGLSAADIGTATHLVLENLDFAAPCDAADIESQIAAMLDRRKLTVQQAAHVDRAAVAWLMSSDLGRLIKQHAGDLLREVPFNLAVSSDEWTAAHAPSAGANPAGGPGVPDRSVRPRPRPVVQVSEPAGHSPSASSYLPAAPSPRSQAGVATSMMPAAPHAAREQDAPLDQIMIRGRIDLMIPTPAGLAVVDYKTDRVWGDDLGARAQYYDGQVRFYQRAIHQITGRPVGAVYLVFLTARRIMERRAESAVEDHSA